MMMVLMLIVYNVLQDVLSVATLVPVLNVNMDITWMEMIVQYVLINLLSVVMPQQVLSVLLEQEELG